MDDLLVPFHRQYLQQVTPSTIRYPPSKHLVVPFVQDQLHRYFFDEQYDRHLPPFQYQTRVLKRVIDEIERELRSGTCDPDEYALSDALVAHMGVLAAMPARSDLEAIQEPRVLSYFLPTNTTKIDENGHHSQRFMGMSQRILIRESPNLLAAGSNVGLRTWEASLRLGYYLSTCPDISNWHRKGRNIAGANIIELGAGTGLLSLICALALQANHVVATDGLPHVVEGIRGNIELNDIANTFKGSTAPTSALLDWTDLSDLDEILMVNGEMPTYDYILGADITYHPVLHDPLAHLTKVLKTKFPYARVLISFTVRNEKTLESFLQVCQTKYGLIVKTMTEDQWKCPDFRNQTGLFHEQAFPIIIMDIDVEHK